MNLPIKQCEIKGLCPHCPYRNEACPQCHSQDSSKMITPEQLHNWYLEAIKELHPESFNPNAKKPYSELTEEQKFIDKYIADKIIEKFVK